jgi:hypothetical protein
VVKQVLRGSSERVGNKQRIAGSLNSVASGEQQETTTLCFSSATKYCQKIMIYVPCTEWIEDRVTEQDGAHGEAKDYGRKGNGFDLCLDYKRHST